MKLNDYPRISGAALLAAAVWLLIILSLVTASGCARDLRPPDKIPERIEAALVFADKLSDTLVSLTCEKFNRAGGCIDPGKALMPEASLELHGKLEEAMGALSVASTLGDGSVARCLGAERTQSDCLSAALGVLTEIDRRIIEAKGGRP